MARLLFGDTMIMEVKEKYYVYGIKNGNNNLGLETIT